MALWVGEKIELYEGELLVFKRANSPMWYLRIYVAKEKKYYQKSCRTKSKFNAIDYAKAQYKEIQQKVSKDEKVFTITLSEALEGYDLQEEERVKRGLIGATWKYQKEVYLRGKFTEYFGSDTQVNQISEDELEKYINERMSILKRKQTVKQEITIIKHLFSTFLIRRGYVYKMPAMPEFRIRYKDTAKREDTFTNKEYDKLVRFMREWVKKKNVSKVRIAAGSYAKRRGKEKKMVDWEWQQECHRRILLRELILICSNTGLRVPKEIMSLTWGDVRVTEEEVEGSYNRSKKVIQYVAKVNIGSDMKTGMRVVTGVAGQYFMRLKKYYEEEFDVKPKDTDLVFMDMFGRNKGKVFERHSFYRLWKELMEIAEMNRILFTPYCLRSFYITQSILNKFDLLLLAKNCGNSIDTIMKHYEFIKMEAQTKDLIKRRNIKEEQSKEVIF